MATWAEKALYPGGKHGFRGLLEFSSWGVFWKKGQESDDYFVRSTVGKTYGGWSVGLKCFRPKKFR
jgi:hypothetical protein